MEPRFDGKRAMITGAGQGIGKAIAIKLYNLGAQVVAVSQTEANLQELKTECEGIETISVDLGNWAKTKEAIKSIGPIDLLVNNAGTTKLQAFTEVTEDAFDRLFAVNVKAIINVSQEVVKGMVKRGKGGAILNLSSMASQVALRDHTVYCATKAAIDSITRTMALELGPHQIRVNSVNPTVVMTEMGKIAWSDPAVNQPMLDRIPLGKFAEVEDVVNAVIFLLSDKAGMINGTHLPIDGGFLSS